MTPRRRYARLAVMLTLALAGCRRPGAAPPTTVVLLDIVPARNREYAEWTREALEGFTAGDGDRGEAARSLPNPRTSSSSSAPAPRRRRDDAGRLHHRRHLAGDAGRALPRPAAAAGRGSGPALPRPRRQQRGPGPALAMPYHANVGILFFRTDLLREYGYRDPPRTWAELETMAAAIQKGERAKGHADFWGFVWQGAPYEGLTCNALEWQVSEGAAASSKTTGRSPSTTRARSRPGPGGGLGRHYLSAGGRRLSRSRRPRRPCVPATPRSCGAGLQLRPDQDDGSPCAAASTSRSCPAGAAGHAMVLGENALAVSRYSTTRRGSHRAGEVPLTPRRPARTRPPDLAPSDDPDLYDDPAVLRPIRITRRSSSLPGRAPSRGPHR